MGRVGFWLCVLLLGGMAVCGLMYVLTQATGTPWVSDYHATDFHW